MVNTGFADSGVYLMSYIYIYWCCVDFCKIFTFTGSLAKNVRNFIPSILDCFVTNVFMVLVNVEHSEEFC